MAVATRKASSSATTGKARGARSGPQAIHRVITAAQVGNYRKARGILSGAIGGYGLFVLRVLSQSKEAMAFQEIGQAIGMRSDFERIRSSCQFLKAAGWVELSGGKATLSSDGRSAWNLFKPLIA